MKPRIVAAVGNSANTGTVGKSAIAKKIEAAMSRAVMDALADGVDINDTEEILRRKMVARRRVADHADR